MDYSTVELEDIDLSLSLGAITKKPRPEGIKTDPALLDFRGIGVVIEEADADVLKIAKLLEALPRQELDKRMIAVVVRAKVAAERGTTLDDGARLACWLFNCEYTRRGIPPVFRGLPEPNPEVREQVGDAFAVDLQWLVTKYQDHATFRKWRGLWKPGQFHSAAKWISGSYPHNQPYWFVRGLTLTDDQQREMHLIKFDRYRTEFERITARIDEIKPRLWGAYHETAKDPRHRSKDPHATIERRLNVWFCTSLNSWTKPRYQRIANLYEARTGQKITRQKVLNDIEILRRDLPECKPKRNPPGPKKREV